MNKAQFVAYIAQENHCTKAEAEKDQKRRNKMIGKIGENQNKLEVEPLTDQKHKNRKPLSESNNAETKQH